MYYTEVPGKTDVLLHRIETVDARPTAVQPKAPHRPCTSSPECSTTGVDRHQSCLQLAESLGFSRRSLNAVMVRDPYQFPLIDSIMYAIDNTKVFTALDCSLG